MSNEQLGRVKRATLPKIYRVVNLEFWSLRNGLGGNGGVIFDIDTKVTRKCRRVRSRDGWKWQIDCRPDDWMYDYPLVQDQEILDQIGSDESEFTVVAAQSQETTK